MKKEVFRLAALIFMMGILVSGCTSSEQKVKNAEEDVIAAKEALDQANAEYRADMEQFRQEAEAKTISNDQMIAELKGRMAQMRSAVRDDYHEKVTILEERNALMKSRMDTYKDEGEDNWYAFKREFNRDMEDLGQALANFTQSSDK